MVGSYIVDAEVVAVLREANSNRPSSTRKLAYLGACNQSGTTYMPRLEPVTITVRLFCCCSLAMVNAGA